MSKLKGIESFSSFSLGLYIRCTWTSLPLVLRINACLCYAQCFHIHFDTSDGMNISFLRLRNLFNVPQIWNHSAMSNLFLIYGFPSGTHSKSYLQIISYSLKPKKQRQLRKYKYILKISQVTNLSFLSLHAPGFFPRWKGPKIVVAPKAWLDRSFQVTFCVYLHK